MEWRVNGYGQLPEKRVLPTHTATLDEKGSEPFAIDCPYDNDVVIAAINDHWRLRFSKTESATYKSIYMKVNYYDFTEKQFTIEATSRWLGYPT